MNMKEWRAARRKAIIAAEGLAAWSMPGSTVPSKKRYKRKPKHTKKESE